MDPPLDGAQRHPGHPDQGAGGHLPGGEQLVHRGVLRAAQHRRPQRGFPGAQHTELVADFIEDPQQRRAEHQQPRRGQHGAVAAGVGIQPVGQGPHRPPVLGRCAGGQDRGHRFRQVDFRVTFGGLGHREEQPQPSPAPMHHTGGHRGIRRFGRRRHPAAVHVQRTRGGA